jgi:hypothetical protein
VSKHIRSNSYSRYYIILICVLLFTLGSELVSNAIVLILLCFSWEKLLISKKNLIIIFGFLIILIPFFLFSQNQLIFRYIVYIPRFVIIISLANYYLIKISLKQLNSVLKVIFIIHCVVILLCFIFPPLNNFLNLALGKAFVSDFRISGLFSGYDFISFFTVLYLYTDYRCNDYKFDALGYIQLFLGFSATIVSGRFGMIPYLIFFLYIFFKNISLVKVVAFTVACAGAFILFYERIMLFYNTFLLLRDSMNMGDIENSKLSLKDYGSEGQEGFYQLSPLVLYNEATLPFTNCIKYILPSTIATDVDSGPSYVIVNIGFILAIFLYIYYFRNLYKGIKQTAFFTILIIVMDVKFRIILAMMPTVWILLNLHKLRKYKESPLI